jgi:subtilase family serine protease
VTDAISDPPASAAVGSAFNLTQTVRNAGAVDAAASISRFYLSTDGAKSAGDMLLTGTTSVPALTPGATASGGRSVTVPSTATAGSYFVVACADDLLAVKELDDSNNCAASRTMVLVGSPDLVASGVSAPPAAAAAGSSFTVGETVQNSSAIASKGSTTRYYLSTDAAKSADDLLLTGTRLVAPLDPGASSSGTATALVPFSAPQGTYRLLACADDFDANDESNESNNCAASSTSLTIALADLLVSSVGQSPAAAKPGGSITITDTTQNVGPVPSGFSTTRYYLSVDGSKSADDVLLSSSRFLSGLGAGASSSGSRTATVPASTALGTYRVLACADDTNGVKESDETNNCAASVGTLLVGLPDLVTTAVSNPPAAASAGSSFTVNDSVFNNSGIAIGTTTSRYYLSSDAALDAADVLLTGTRLIFSMTGNETSSGSRLVTIPSGTAQGRYRLLACADDTQAVAEANEANNCLASAAILSIALPDLVAISITNPPATIAPGASFAITDTVQNVGAVSVPATTVRYYLSADRSQDSGDLRFTATRLVTSLAAGSSSAGTIWLAVPTGTVPGPYYVLACADDLDKAAEGNESNNCIASATQVTVGGQ